ncbi:MAG: amino acid permease [Gammaproteobacteria bacterium]
MSASQSGPRASVWSRMKRVKPLHMIRSDAADPEHRLSRTLSAVDLTSLGIGAIIGTGIFVLIGTAIVGDSVRLGAGPGITLSFLVAGLACGLAALCYAEFAAMIPVAGSAYTYTYVTLGEFIAWITGWNLVLEYGVASVAVAVGWSGYFNKLLQLGGIHLPHWATHAPGGPDGGLVNLPASIIVLLVTWVLVVGIKESARTTSVIVVVKLAIILFFIAVGGTQVNPENWTPYLPNGYAGVGAAAAIVFFAYIGFDAVSTAAEEAKNPQRDMPIGIIASLGICTLLYLLVAAILTGMVPWNEVDVHAPIAAALEMLGFKWGAALVSVGAVAGITSVLIVLLMGQVRIFFAMSRDGLLGGWLASVHPRFRTPYRASWLTGIVVAILAGVLDLGAAADMTNIGTLFAFLLVCVAVIFLRYTRPDERRPFRTPLMPWLPIAGALACFALMTFLPWVTWARFLIWTVLGLGIYFGYSIRRSRLNQLEQSS